jgi:hypothetical protein
MWAKETSSGMILSKEAAERMTSDEERMYNIFNEAYENQSGTLESLNFIKEFFKDKQLKEFPRWIQLSFSKCSVLTNLLYVTLHGKFIESRDVFDMFWALRTLPQVKEDTIEFVFYRMFEHFMSSVKSECNNVKKYFYLNSVPGSSFHCLFRDELPEGSVGTYKEFRNPEVTFTFKRNEVDQ